MGKKSELPVDKGVEVVLALLRKEEPAAQIARRNGISERSISRARSSYCRSARLGESGEKKPDEAMAQDAELNQAA
ncbi:MAG: hypothetical protein AB1648_12375 [Pseudomonadota bacterium]|jgi:hypothetical protein